MKKNVFFIMLMFAISGCIGVGTQLPMESCKKCISLDDPSTKSAYLKHFTFDFKYLINADQTLLTINGVLRLNDTAYRHFDIKEISFYVVIMDDSCKIVEIKNLEIDAFNKTLGMGVPMKGEFDYRSDLKYITFGYSVYSLN